MSCCFSCYGAKELSNGYTEEWLANYQARRGVKIEIVSVEPKQKRIVVAGEPVAKPRQSRSDKWKERPCVVRYREWADRARAAAGTVPSEAQHADIVIYLPLPQSLSAKKRSAMAGTPHRVKPDIDNLIKAALDALLKRDQGIHEIRAKKFWEDKNGPRVEITLY